MFFWANARYQAERLPARFSPNDAISPPLSVLDILSLSDSEIDWKLVAARAQEAPHELRHKDAIRKHTALFLAIQRDAPPFVIKTFLQLYPEAASYVQRLGLSPLHLSVARGTPAVAVQYILDAWPAAASSKMNDGCVPLHFVRDVETARILLEAWPEALFCANNASYLPLHRVATAAYASPELVQLLVDAAKTSNNQQIYAKTMHGMTPLHVACEMVERDLLERVSVCPVKWENLIILAKATHDNLLQRQQHNKTMEADVTSENCFCLLHVLLEVLDPPLCLIQHLFLKCPEERSKLDRQGRSALSVVASKRDIPNHFLSTLLRDPVMDKLAKWKDKWGRLPMHYAAMSGRSFEDGLEILWKAAPLALTTPDPQTGLYPVLLAASGSDQCCNSRCRLNTIFCLLRESPWLIPRTKGSEGGSEKVVRSLPRPNCHGALVQSYVGTLFWLVLPIVAALIAKSLSAHCQ